MRRDNVAQCARHWHPELGIGCREADVRCGRDQRAAADTEAANHGDRRLLHRLEAAQRGADHPFVAEDVVRGLERGELGDIRARDERAIACAPQYEHADSVVGVGVLARIVQTLVHRPRHCISRGGPVEGEDGGRPAPLV